MSVPIEARPLFEFLSREVQELCDIYKALSDLLRTGEDTLTLLNNSAPGFFTCAVNAMMRDSKMMFCRLCDTPKSLGKDNASIYQLAQCLEKLTPGLLAMELQQIEKASKPVLKERHKRLAHLDLASALRAPNNLFAPSWEQFDAALSALCGYLNSIRCHYGEKEWNYSNHQGDQEWGVPKLLKILERGTS